MSEQIEWEGYVERITFRNEENGYTVLFLVDAEEEEEVCCVGQFSYVAEGLYLKVTGREVIHKNYGPADTGGFVRRKTTKRLSCC